MNVPIAPPHGGVLHAGTLDAAYTLALSATTGEWFAIGTVRAAVTQRRQPVWIISGTGATPELAVEELRHQLERELLCCSPPGAA